MTAAHCLSQTPTEHLWVNHHGGLPTDLFTAANRIEVIPEADLAIVCTDAPGARWVQPFQTIRTFANVGENICALGYPFEAISRERPNEETMRFFRGSIQRPFHHKSTLAPGNGYSAYELSFPCPFGLSGGPLFLEGDPETVLGVITEDLWAGRELYQEEIEQSPEGINHIIKTYRVINYGVAANLFAAADILEVLVGRSLLKHSND